MLASSRRSAHLSYIVRVSSSTHFRRLGTSPVWVPSLAFIVLVVASNILEPELLQHPLSFCRDGRAAVVGWAAFVSLVLAIAGYSAVYLRAPAPLRRYAFGPLVAVGLMVLVTVTPTVSLFHDVAAALVMLSVTEFFTVRLVDVSPWVAAGFAVSVVTGAGVVLLFSPQWSQKLLILVQVVTMNFDARRVVRSAGEPGT